MEKARINLKTLQNQALGGVEKADNQAELQEASKQYLGKQGELGRILSSIKKLPKTKRAAVGKKANDLKNLLEKKIKEKGLVLINKASQPKEEIIDITAPGERTVLGHLHPLTQVKKRTEEIFEGMGFSVVEGPEVEDEWHNFDALNIPKEHPARDLWNTFWLSGGSERMLLRTHTSPVQIRYMEKNNPPLRIIAPGRVFRHEATDASHEVNFNQIEGLMVGKDVSVANFKAVMQEFFQRFFAKSVQIRLRPSFFPFTEPSFEVDMTCLNCQGSGCSVCSRSGWLEMGGAGMVHPDVLKAAGLISGDWQGFAFGMGIDRLAMMKYRINDIRLFYSGDLRFLQQF